MSKYKRDVCPECKVKEGDSRKKTLYQCNLCERWFCAKHFEPKLVRIPDYKAFAKYPEARVIFEKERREDGHPDFEYSLKRIKELDMEEKLYSKLIEDALNRSKAYRKPIPRETEKEGKLYFVKEESPTSPSLDIETRKTKTRKPFPTKKVVGLFLAVMILGALLWYAPTLISTIQNYFSQSSYTKVTVVAGQVSDIKFNDNEYFFMYPSPPWIEGNQFSISTPTLSAKIHPAIEGATYYDFGLEIKVSEVHTDYIVLLVKPTY